MFRNYDQSPLYIYQLPTLIFVSYTLTSYLDVRSLELNIRHPPMNQISTNITLSCKGWADAYIYFERNPM